MDAVEERESSPRHLVATGRQGAVVDRPRAVVAAREYAQQVQPIIRTAASATARVWAAMPDGGQKPALERHASRITGLAETFAGSLAGNVSSGREAVNREDALAIDSALSIVNAFTGPTQRTIYAEVPNSVELQGRAQAAVQTLTALKQALSQQAIQQNVLAPAMGDDSGNDDPNR